MNYYDILHTHANASPDEIKQAWRTITQIYHPDQLRQKPATVQTFAERQLKVINEAYSVLADPAKRREYDATLEQPTHTRPVSRVAHATSEPRVVQPVLETLDDLLVQAERARQECAFYASELAKIRQASMIRRHRFWQIMLLSGLGLALALLVALVENILVVGPMWWLLGLAPVLQIVTTAILLRHIGTRFGNDPHVLRNSVNLVMIGTWVIGLVGPLVALFFISDSVQTLFLSVIGFLALHFILCWAMIAREAYGSDQSKYTSFEKMYGNAMRDAQHRLNYYTTQLSALKSVR